MTAHMLYCVFILFPADSEATCYSGKEISLILSFE